MYKYRACRDFYLIAVIFVGIFFVVAGTIELVTNTENWKVVLLTLGAYLLIAIIGNFLLPKRIISEKGIKKGKFLYSWSDIAEISIKENFAYAFRPALLPTIIPAAIKFLFLRNSKKYTKYDLLLMPQYDRFYISEKAFDLIKQYGQCEIN
jgi:hypothetical protein